ncbi:MAG: glycosyltransferase family 2 protein [Anaerolineae bacterium]|nr:glycosyltransferase family 2 protein [Anaerolineae bacterium]
MFDLAVIIVSWNTRDLTIQTIQSLLADVSSSQLMCHILVVDNASEDNSVAAIQAQFADVEILVSETNLGFGGANNLGMRHLGFGQEAALADLRKAVYLLNSDTITQTGATDALYNALFSAPDVGLVGARLTYGDGQFQESAFALPGLRQLYAELFWIPGRFRLGQFNGRYPQSLYEQPQPFEVDFTLGATMMLRSEVIQQTGMFDEAFFMYCEEIDWAWRIKDAGWRVLCVPQAHVIHLAGQSTVQVKPRSIINLWESRLRLADKHYPRWKYWLARQIIAFGMHRKMSTLEGDPSTPEDVRDAYRKVLSMAQNGTYA